MTANELVDTSENDHEDDYIRWLDENDQALPDVSIEADSWTSGAEPYSQYGSGEFRHTHPDSHCISQPSPPLVVDPVLLQQYQSETDLSFTHDSQQAIFGKEQEEGYFEIEYSACLAHPEFPDAFISVNDSGDYSSTPIQNSTSTSIEIIRYPANVP